MRSPYAAWYPNWRGRWRYLEPILWQDHGAWQTAVALYRWQTPEGWKQRYYWLCRHFGDEQVYVQLVANQTFLTTGTGVQTATSDATWNNANNSVEVVGGGGSGGYTLGSAAQPATGGGGGEYGNTTNFTFATPGTTTFQYQIGQGGAAKGGVAGTGSTGDGNAGTDSWFNGATQAGSTLGAIHGNGGIGTGLAPQNGGAGGTGGVGTTHRAGGRGGNSGSTNSCTGGGGAAGPNAVGTNGVDGTSATAFGGGQGDGSSGGAGGAGTTTSPGGAGSAGTELGDSVHGCGGGGGGCLINANSAALGGNGGLYGAGSGACRNIITSGANRNATSGAGAQGIVVLTWTPAAAAQVYVFADLQTFVQTFRMVEY